MKLEALNTNPDRFGDGLTKERLAKIVGHSQELGFIPFQATQPGGEWVTVAPNPDVVYQHQNILEELDALQSKFSPSELWGSEVYIHMVAIRSGPGQGLMKATYGNPDSEEIKRSIYPEGGRSETRIHYLGFRNEEQNTIYFDLSAKAYLFTPKRDDDVALFEGLVVVDALKATDMIDRLYGVSWQIDDRRGRISQLGR